MTNNPFFKWLQEKGISYATSADSYKDCVEYKGYRFLLWQRKKSVSIPSLVTEESEDGIYIAEYSDELIYFLAVQNSGVLQGSDLVISRALLEKICQQYPNLKVIQLNTAVIKKWKIAKKAWAFHNNIRLGLYSTLCIFSIFFVISAVGVVLS